MALTTSEIIAPYSVAIIPFGSTAATTGTAPTASTFHRVFYCEKPTYIVGFQIGQSGVDSGQTFQAQYVSTTTAGTPVTFGAATSTLAAAGVLSLDVDSASAGAPVLLPAGSFVGFLTNSTTVTNSKVNYVVIKYRCPQ